MTKGPRLQALKRGPSLLALLLALPLCAAGAETREPARVLAGLSLGVAEKELAPDFQARDLSKSYAEEPLSPGEKALSLAPLPEGATSLLGRFYEGRLWRLELGYPSAYAAKHPWSEFEGRPSQLYGLPQLSSESGDGFVLRSAVWSSSDSRLAYERLQRADSSEYRIILEDRGVLASLEAAALGRALGPSETPRKGRLCEDYLDCLGQAAERLTRDDCAGAQPYLDFAAKLDPGLPDAYLYRAVMFKRSGYIAAGKREFSIALRYGPALEAQGDGEGGAYTQYGPCRSKALLSTKPSETVDLSSPSLPTPGPIPVRTWDGTEPEKRRK